MKSLTKFQITGDKVAELFLAAGIAGVTAIQEISDGWFNSVFLAAGPDGKKYVIKIAPPPSARVLSYEKDMMASEVGFYRLINEKTGVKAPEIVFQDFSGKNIPAPFFIMEFLSGERLDKARLSPEEKKETENQWAWILSEFHKVKGEGFGYRQTGLEGSWKKAFAHMTLMLIGDCASFGKKCKIGNRLLGYIEKFSAALEDVPCALVNFDMHGKNLFYQKTEGKITLSVLDLERCFWGDPLGDFITPEFFKALPDKSMTAAYNGFAETPLSLSREEEIRYHLLCAYLAAIMYTERFSRFKSFRKIFHPVYLTGTIGYKMLARISFSALKRLSK